MNINEEMIKNGVEVDMPKLPGALNTEYAIRYVRPEFEYYNFKTGKIIYRAKDLKYIVEEANRIHGTNDVVV